MSVGKTFGQMKLVGGKGQRRMGIDGLKPCVQGDVVPLTHCAGR